MKIATVIGAGSWGTALATVLAANSYFIRLHSYDPDVVDEINNYHTNLKYLKTSYLSSNIQGHTDYKDALKDSELVVLAVPSHAFKQTFLEIKPYISSNVTIVSATKGFDEETLLTMTEILKANSPSNMHQNIGVLSGPSHAEEVIKGIPTAVISASHNENTAKTIQKAFNNRHFRVYTSDDVLGVELCGSFKNVIAIGAGISDGLGMGDNTKAALLTRGLTEMTRLGLAMGAKRETFHGLAGLGDLIVTGNSKHSRNWKTGKLIANGCNLDSTLKQIGMVAEGVKAAKTIQFLSEKYNIETPISNEICKVIFSNKNPRNAIADLMKRDLKEE